MRHGRTRRQYLATLCIGGLAGIAGCSDSGESTRTPAAAGTTSQAATSTAPPDSSDSDSPEESDSSEESDSPEESDPDGQPDQLEGTALDSGSTFVAGQNVFVRGLTPNRVYRVRGIDSDGLGPLRRTVPADDSGNIGFELSAELSGGGFVVVDRDDDVVPVASGEGQSPRDPTPAAVAEAAFQVATQDFVAEFDSASVGNADGATTVGYEVAAATQDSYTVNVSADGLDSEELSAIFGTEATIVDTSDTDTIQITRRGSDTAQGSYSLDFTGVSSGTYTFEANVSDAAGSATDDIQVVDTDAASAEFGSSLYSVQRGETVTITLELANSDVATLQIGVRDESGYALVAEVSDDNGDGSASVEFDTYTAGNGTPSDALAAGSDTSLSNIDTRADSYVRNQPTGSEMLDAGQYNLLVAGGESSGVNTSTADSRATLDINEA